MLYAMSGCNLASSGSSGSGSPPALTVVSAFDLGTLTPNGTLSGEMRHTAQNFRDIRFGSYGDTALVHPDASGRTFLSNTWSYTTDFDASNGISGFLRSRKLRIGLRAAESMCSPLRFIATTRRPGPKHMSLCTMVHTRSRKWRTQWKQSSKNGRSFLFCRSVQATAELPIKREAPSAQLLPRQQPRVHQARVSQRLSLSIRRPKAAGPTPSCNLSPFVGLGGSTRTESQERRGLIRRLRLALQSAPGLRSASKT